MAKDLWLVEIFSSKLKIRKTATTKTSGCFTQLTSNLRFPVHHPIMVFKTWRNQSSIFTVSRVGSINAKRKNWITPVFPPSSSFLHFMWRGTWGEAKDCQPELLLRLEKEPVITVGCSFFLILIDFKQEENNSYSTQK